MKISYFGSRDNLQPTYGPKPMAANIFPTVKQWLCNSISKRNAKAI